MPKTRVQKEQLLAAFSDRMNRSQSVVFVSTIGIKVNEVEMMRDTLFEHGLQLQVAKNSLLKRALTELKLEVPEELLDQPLALIYSYDDAVAAPKQAAAFKKEVEALNILGGIAGGVYLTPAQVNAYAKLPSREQLLAQLVGTINAPVSGFVNVLAGNVRSIVNVLGAIRDSKQAA
ncbi:MAG TPA: 50S ribosomal protein L10 [Verrucomicrobiae bacterium]|nr:50S ribosomal protein L10 [Verrucomicrobiae bacterium]